MLNFIPWPSNIIFLLCMHVLEKRKKIRFQPGKEMPEKKGKYLKSGNTPSPCPRQHSLSHCWDVPAEHSVPAGARGTAAFSELPEHKLGAVSAGLVLSCSSLLRAQRWHSSSGCGREQRGWGGFCSLHVLPRGHLAPVPWW